MPAFPNGNIYFQGKQTGEVTPDGTAVYKFNTLKNIGKTWFRDFQGTSEGLVLAAGINLRDDQFLSLLNPRTGQELHRTPVAQPPSWNFRDPY